jgi:hypothetical protein
MKPDEVKAALDGAWKGGGQGTAEGWRWTPYQNDGVIGVYDQESFLVAVAIRALEGPLVRVGEVELIGRVPSEVRAEICGLASRQGVAMRVNRSGDPEITAWGLSMGTEQEWGRLPEEQIGRKDTVVTSALFTSPGITDDAAMSVIRGIRRPRPGQEPGGVAGGPRP